MAFFGRKNPKPGKTGGKHHQANSDIQIPPMDPAALRQNNVTRLTLDERWTGLFTGLTLPPSLLELQQQMNELIRQEANQNGELERLEPTKKRAMHDIIRLTKEAFEDGDEKAKAILLKKREEIETINLRWSKLLEERDALIDTMRDLNVQLLQETVRHVFATMRRAQTEVPALDAEIHELEARLHQRRQDRDRLALDWNHLSEPFSRLLGTTYVRQLETQFILEIQASRALLAPVAQPESAQVGASPAGTAHTDTAQGGTTQSGTTQSGTTPSGTTQSGTTQGEQTSNKEGK